MGVALYGLGVMTQSDMAVTVGDYIELYAFQIPLYADSL